MNSPRREERQRILYGLTAIGELGAKAESIKPDLLLRRTLPIRAHVRALEPDVLLVIGGRGAGKSHLFRVINLPDGPRALGYHASPSGAIWLPGFTTRPTISPTPPLPGETVLQRFAEGRSRTDLMDFWRGLLLGVVLGSGDLRDGDLVRHVRDGIPQPLVDALRDPSAISDWYESLTSSLERVERALDRLDQELERRQQHLIATYDDLDVMAVEWNEKRALIQALLQFWLGGWRRWRRLRPNFFLRRDLIAPDFLAFPDASKFDAHKMELRWTPTQLYQLVFKLWANEGDDCRGFVGKLGLCLTQDNLLGWTYTGSDPTEDALRICVEKIVGPFMGGGPKKGRTFAWIPNHLQDAIGEIVPRSMINLFSLAAQDELEHSRASETLLSPLSFQVALEETSRRRILELQEEYPWLEAVRPVLTGRHVPIPRDDLAILLGEIEWSGVERPPISREPNALIDSMLQIGILRLTLDKRIHVPDIYLYGFGLKRKGGIRRPRTEVTA